MVILLLPDVYLRPYQASMMEVFGGKKVILWLWTNGTKYSRMDQIKFVEDSL